MNQLSSTNTISHEALGCLVCSDRSENPENGRGRVLNPNGYLLFALYVIREGKIYILGHLVNIPSVSVVKCKRITSTESLLFRSTVPFLLPPGGGVGWHYPFSPPPLLSCLRQSGLVVAPGSPHLLHQVQTETVSEEA